MPGIGFLFLPRRGNPIFLFFGNRTQREGDEVEEEGQCNGENYIGDEERCLRGSFSADMSTKSFNLHLPQMGQGGSLYLLTLFVVWFSSLGTF